MLAGIDRQDSKRQCFWQRSVSTQNMVVLSVGSIKVKMGHNRSPLLLCFLALSLLIPIHSIEISQTFCTDGHFSEGCSGTIMCFFTKDLNATRRNFNVVRYPLGSTTDSGNAIYLILCNWAHGQSLECTGKPEYQLHNTVVTNNVTLKISSVKKEMEGLHFCQEVPGNGQPTLPCSLFVTDTSPSSSPRSPSMATSTTAKSVFTATTSSSQGESSKFIAVLLTCLFFIIVSLYLTAAHFYIRLLFHLHLKHNDNRLAPTVESALCCIRHSSHATCSRDEEVGISRIQPPLSSQEKGNVENPRLDLVSKDEAVNCFPEEDAGHQSMKETSGNNCQVAEEEIDTERIPLTAQNSAEDCRMTENDGSPKQAKPYIDDHYF